MLRTDAHSRRAMFRTISISVLIGLAPCCLSAAEPTVKGITYAEADGHTLLLDLYLPDAQQPPLLVWVHGGAWKGGSRANPPLGFLVDQGYAMASVDYRLSTVAQFPS